MAQTKPTHTVYIVRHGQCVTNASGVIQIPEQDNITDYGRKQADALGDYLKDVQFTSAFASTFQRAIETAKHILSKSINPCPEPLKTDTRIRERGIGDFIGLQGKQVRIIIMKHVADGQSINSMEVPGGETLVEYGERIRSFFQELFDGLRNVEILQTILIVSHGLAMRHFLNGLADIFSDMCDASNWDKKCGASIKNTGLTQFTLEFPSPAGKPQLRLLKINEVEHLNSLEEETGTKPATFNEEYNKMLEKLSQIPGAREEISPCVQV